MDFVTERRRFLQMAGAGATVSLAGCSSLQNDGVQSDSDTTQAGETPTVTLLLEIDRMALQQVQAELQQKLQNGTINQTEAQQQFRTAQTELIGAAIEAFREEVRDDDSITIEETANQLGILLVTGSPASLIGTLEMSDVRGLLPEATFEEAQSQSPGF